MKKTFKEFLTKPGYSEGPRSLICHNGIYYKLDRIFELSLDLPVTKMPLSNLQWLIDANTADPERLKNANINVPIIVTPQGGQYVIIDGYHRVVKALQAGETHIQARIIFDDILAMSRQGSGPSVAFASNVDDLNPYMESAEEWSAKWGEHDAKSRQNPFRSDELSSKLYHIGSLKSGVNTVPGKVYVLSSEMTVYAVKDGKLQDYPQYFTRGAIAKFGKNQIESYGKKYIEVEVDGSTFRVTADTGFANQSSTFAFGKDAKKGYAQIGATRVAELDDAMKLLNDQSPRTESVEKGLGDRFAFSDYKDWKDALPKGTTFHTGTGKDESIVFAQSRTQHFEGVSGKWDMKNKKGWIYSHYLNKKNLTNESADEVVILRKDPGDAKSFWTGINWMGTKKNAAPVKKSEVAALERQWRTRTKQFPVDSK